MVYKIYFRSGHVLLPLRLSFTENGALCILTKLPPLKHNQVKFHIHKESLHEPFSENYLSILHKNI